MANVSQLQPALTPQVQITHSEAPEKNADFLALRLLNKRARLRLSPSPIDLTNFPGKASLFAIANLRGWFAAVTREDASSASAMILSPLVDLHSALVAASAEDEQPYWPQRRVPIDVAAPHILTFACNDSRILLGQLDGSIQVYDSGQLFSSGQGSVQPIHVCAASSSVAILSVQPNPGDIPELVAILRDCTNSPGSLAVELFDVQKLTSSGGWTAGNSPSTTPTSISWSPKGKQLALGLQGGDLVCFSPSATAIPKSSIPHPPSANNMSVISVHWLSASSFHTIYAPPGQLTPEAEQIHFHVSLDSKSNSAQAIRFNNPYLPFPGLRPPGEFLVSLRGWDPSKVLLFIGDSTSSDIGLIGSVADDARERWHNLALEETSTPSLPLDKDQNDTILLGMGVDLTCSESYHYSTASGEALELPAHPIMYVYASDGTVLGWHVLNVTGAPYPGMITTLNASTPALSVPSIPSSIVRELSSDMQTTPIISPITSAAAEPIALNPPSTGFGQPPTISSQGSTFGQTPVFGQTQFGFGQQPTSAFGEASSFGQSATTSTFGSAPTSSAFGQPPEPAFGSTTSVGFGAFSSTGPAKFEQPTFGFGGPPQATLTLPSSTPVPEESMAADDIPSLGSLGLGTANSQDVDSKPSIFGKTVPVSSNQQSTDGSLIKPGSGFRLFAGFDEKSPFASTTDFSSVQQPTATSIFGAFASGSQSAFAMAASKTGPSTKPVWATGDVSKPPKSSPFGAPTNVFGKPTESSEPKTLSATPQTSAFIKPASGAFGESPKDSPFFAPKLPGPEAGSAFALLATPATPTSTPPRVSSVQPAFGMSSMPGVRLQNPQDTDLKSSIFGKTSAPVSSGPRVTDDSLIKPDTGFGAFSSTPQSTGAFAFSAFSSGAQNAFAVAASKNGPSTKPVWTTGASSKPAAGSPDPKTPSAMPWKTTDSSTTPPPFTTASTYSVPSQFAPRDSSIRDNESRFPSPAPVPSKVTTSSVFSSSTPGPSAGAFSDLHTTPSAFVKPASGGFGELPRDSPFFAPKPLEPKPVSVFALSATPTTPTSAPPKASTAQPTFGATSMPSGAFNSAFPPVVAEPAQSALATSAGGFSSFSSGGGGFTSFSSGGIKSFGDLLRSTKEEKPSRAEPSEATPTKPTQAPPQPLVSTTPAKEPPKPPSTPPVTSQPEGEEQMSNVVEVTAGKVSAEPKERGVETILIQEPSLESISSSTSSSFVKVSAEEGEVVEGATGEAEQREDAESLPSSEVPSEAEESREEEPEVSEEEESEVSEEEALSEAADGEEQVVKETEPTEIPLPTSRASTRSPSTTPKAEPPNVSVSVSPPPQIPSPSIVPRVSPVRDFGTTPPGTPVKDVPSVPVQMPVPTLKASPLSTSPFGLAPRSNNRPIRSSPLASSPLVIESEVEKPPPVSKSAPPAMVAQPAAPKVPFGQWTPPPPPPAQLADDSTLPRTPPISSLFSVPVEKPVPSIFTPTSTPAPAPSVFTPPGKVATTIMPTTTPGPSAPVFALPTSFPSFTPSTAMPGVHGMPIFTPPLAKTPTPSPTPEQGMQAECVLLVTTLTKELENLKQLATMASLKTEELRKTSGVAHQKADLSDPHKWAFGDIEEYGSILVDVQTDIKELKLQRVSLRKAMKELGSNVLKVNTRKEEIARFNKAKTDVEFAKMLKIRTLAPESSETQSQLRRNIRVIRDRVQKLEDHLQASKKRINEFRTGRPSIRPPSLDTVNRTFRNIDAVIDQQKQEISLLRYRMAKLEISGSVATREQLALSISRRPLNMTTNVAMTTAAALNAERSAQKLKKAILGSRTRPLLNTTAVTSPVLTSFQTPQKVVEPDVKRPELKRPELKRPDSGFALPTTPTMGFPSPLPGWTPSSPPSSELGSPTLPFDNTPSRNRGGTKHHQKPIVLKKNASPGGPTQPAIASPFEWKPVEPIKPVSSLPFALRRAGSS